MAIEHIERRTSHNLDHHPIPPMTDPLSSHWEQPSRELIEIDDKYAMMSIYTFRQLHEYSGTNPTGVIPERCGDVTTGALIASFLLAAESRCGCSAGSASATVVQSGAATTTGSSSFRTRTSRRSRWKKDESRHHHALSLRENISKSDVRTIRLNLSSLKNTATRTSSSAHSSGISVSSKSNHHPP